MKAASLTGGLLLAMLCAGCTTSGSGGIVLFPLPYKLLEETKGLKAAHPNPVVWPRELNKNVTGPAVAEPGDLLSVAAVDPAMRVPFVGEQPILIDGTIDLAKYGRVVVGYKTLAEIEAIVNAHLKSNGGRDLAVTVRFARAPESKRVYVLGDVVTPGSYPINGNETVLDAIMLAGGLTRKADERNIILSRPTAVCDCRIVLPICHEEIVQWGDTSTNYQLLPGDRIYVPTLSLWNRIFGRKGQVCPPCGRCPSPCPIPEENCGVGCAPGYGPAHEHVVSVQLPGGDVTAPAGTTAPTTPAPASPPRLEERRLPPPQTLKETPREATALPPSRRLPAAGLEFNPALKAMPQRPTMNTTTVDPSFQKMSTRSALPMAAPKTAEPVRDSKESVPTADLLSPWRPASARTTP
jgi:protein involved in polysaccharide export with SLBB domain